MKYKQLASTFKQLEDTQKTLEKTDILADLFKSNPEDLRNIILLVNGEPVKSWEDFDLGISSRMMVEIIAEATGFSKEEVEKEWKDKGDLGLAAEELVQNKKQTRLMSKELTVERVVEKLRKIARNEKEGISESVSMDKKKKQVAELISSAQPLEARYIARNTLNNLRIGVGEGIIRDALSEAFFEGEHTEKIQKAYDYTNDFTKVAEACKKDIEEVRKLEIEIYRPVKSMLAKKVETVEEGFEEVGKPAAIDYKYDGVRAQIHLGDEGAKVYTRRLEDVTKQFPDVAKYVEKNVDAETAIIDAEIVGYNPEDGSTIPFQKLSQRIKRKYDIQKMKEKVPVELRPFDVIYLNGENTMKKRYEKRWKDLCKIVTEQENQIKLVDHKVTEDSEEVAQWQHESLAKGHEGIMMKSLDAEYKPGSRVGYMVKLKPVMETLDLAIIGGEWSEGRRSGWIGSLKLGCWNQKEGKYEEVGKMATGLTDEQLEEITERLKPLITSEDGRDVKTKPKVIVEAEYEEIQKSPTYTSGYAMRFPRLKAFRDDKERADGKEKIERLYEDQK